jgi:hypothetical protein
MSAKKQDGNMSSQGKCLSGAVCARALCLGSCTIAPSCPHSLHSERQLHGKPALLVHWIATLSVHLPMPGRCTTDITKYFMEMDAATPAVPASELPIKASDIE